MTKLKVSSVQASGITAAASTINYGKFNGVLVNGSFHAKGTAKFDGPIFLGNDTNDSITITGNSNATSSTASTSTTTGALVVAGGVGIGGNVNVGGTATFNAAIFNSDLIKAATTLTQANSGWAYSIIPTSAYTITLPTSPIIGIHYDFIVITTAGSAVTIAAGSPIIYGNYNNNNTLTQISAKSNYIINATAAIGDIVSFKCIYTTSNSTIGWLVTGATTVTGGASTS